MIFARQTILCLAAAAVAWTAPAQTIQPAPVPAQTSSTLTNLLPPMPHLGSPVSYFRQLLMMSPAERNNSLTNRTPEARAIIMAKLREYRALPPDERELRLRATELRWYLVPLMRMAPADRAGRLTQAPPELVDLLNTRLAQWDELPPATQAEFLANDRTVHFFAQPPAPAATNAEPDKIAGQFNQFFVLTPGEQQRLLGTLSETERARMEKTLKVFEQLPGPKRALCIRNYAKFAGMNSDERAQFLKNADSWSKMSPQERQTWRELIDMVPMWPTLPPVHPALPPRIPPVRVRSTMATN